MSASFISATNVFIVPPPVTNPAASKKKFIAKLDERCRALTKLPGARDHSGPQCSRRKVLNTDIPQAEKTLKDIAADELCNQHKLMLDRFIDMVAQQLYEEKRVTPKFAGRPAGGSKINAGSAIPNRAPSGSAAVDRRGFGNDMALRNDMTVNMGRGYGSPIPSIMSDAGRSSAGNINHGTFPGNKPRHDTANLDSRSSSTRNSPLPDTRVSTSRDRQFFDGNTRTGIPHGRQSHTGFPAKPLFQEEPNSRIDKGVFSSSRAPRDDTSSLVDICISLIQTHKPRQAYGKREVLNTEKDRMVEGLGTELDNFLYLHDAVGGTLIKECETLIDSHARSAEGFSSVSGKQKQQKLKELRAQLDELRICVKDTIHGHRDEVRYIEDEESEEEEL